MDGEPIEPGRICTAAPDHPLRVEEGRRIPPTRGPRAHHTRPAIDPLFRSGAVHGGPRVVGVLRGGCKDDGTAGLQAMKVADGMALVQDPAEAPEPVMPRSALANVEVDHCLPTAGRVEVLARVAGQPVQAPRGEAGAKQLDDHVATLRRLADQPP